jgi:uncharacterized protein
MSGFLYAAVPILTWFTVGILKFLINSLKEKRFALDRIGYGGMPSNHCAIVSSVATVIGCREGVDSSVFGVAVALVFIVVIDANGLRRAVGRHAVAINQLSGGQVTLREIMGHNNIEILVGLFVGSLIGFLSVNFDF